MKILISGSSGFIGSKLVEAFKNNGAEVFRLIRKEMPEEGAIFWDPHKGQLDVNSLEGFDVIINLAGENIANKRWNEEYKRRILESRLEATRNLAMAIARLKRPPEVFLNASAVGYYGDHGSTFCTEQTANGSGFLAEVCHKWEEATIPIETCGVRTISLRFGIVLSKDEGVLAKMLPAFSWGLGGKLGSGHQYMSWVSIDDLIEIVAFVIKNREMRGAVNVVTPYPVTNSQFTQTLGRVLKKPTYFSVPAFILQLLMGKEMAQELLLNSIRVEPMRLTIAGYTFRHPDLYGALHHFIGNSEHFLEKP